MNSLKHSISHAAVKAVSGDEASQSASIAVKLLSAAAVT